MRKKICAVYGEGALTDRTCQKCFVKLCAGDFSLDDAARPGRPDEVDSNQIETLLEEKKSTFYHAGESQHTQNIQINSYW